MIQRNWFGVTSRKSSTAADVQSYLSAFESIQLPLLFAIVNLADADVCTSLSLSSDLSYLSAVTSAVVDLMVIFQPNLVG